MLRNKFYALHKITPINNLNNALASVKYNYLTKCYRRILYQVEF